MLCEGKGERLGKKGHTRNPCLLRADKDDGRMPKQRRERIWDMGKFEQQAKDQERNLGRVEEDWESNMGTEFEITWIEIRINLGMGNL